MTKSELKSWSSYTKVPVIKMDNGEVVVDSTSIISRLDSEIRASAGKQPGSSSSGESGKKKSGGSWFKGGSSSGEKAGSGGEEEEEKWRRWVDDRFVKVITANIYRSWE